MLRVTSMKDFIGRKTIGLLLRVFAVKESDIPKRIEMIKGFIDRAQAINIQGKPVFRKIDVLVWMDQRYELRDCGKTADAMRKALHYENVRVHKVEHGDLFCATLNYGIAIQKTDYSMIASAEARTYLNQATMERVVQALCDGARVSGVAINELTQSILEGRIANTFAIWHRISLITAGGFDLSAAMPYDMELAYFVRGYNEQGNKVFYHKSGVEEMIPLAELVKNWDACIAPVLPCQDDGTEVRYEEPNAVTQPELYERYVSKMGTKWKRQIINLLSVNCDDSHLKGGVMEAYRQF